MTRLASFLQKYSVLVADGATGTQLQKAGLPAGAAPERWNLENPDAVRNLHKSYIQAGSMVVLTNTFGGTSYRLGRDGLGDKVYEINLAAAKLARECAGEKVLVFGDIGPTGQILKPVGTVDPADAVAAFTVQARGLVDGGVDAILIETMSDLEESKAAVEGVRAVAKDLPILTTMSFDSHGRTMMGVKPALAARELWGLGVFAIGANCGRTLSETLDAVTAMRQAVPEARLMAKPNAGLPHTDGSNLIYDVTPETMAEYAQKFREAGVVIFGGCCGSGPEHIRAVAKSMQS